MRGIFSPRPATGSILVTDYFMDTFYLSSIQHRYNRMALARIDLFTTKRGSMWARTANQ